MDSELEEALKNLRRFANSERFKKYCEEQSKPKTYNMTDAKGRTLTLLHVYSDGSCFETDVKGRMKSKEPDFITRKE